MDLGAKTHLDRELDSQVPEPTQAQDRHQIPWPGSTAAQRVEHRHPSTGHRRGIGGGELLGNPRQRGSWNHHRLRVATRIRRPGGVALLAVHELTTPTRVAVAALPTRPAHSDPITNTPTPHTRTHDVDPASHLVARSQRETQPR